MVDGNVIIGGIDGDVGVFEVEIGDVGMVVDGEYDLV